jgi:hypothetical protein
LTCTAHGAVQVIGALGPDNVAVAPAGVDAMLSVSSQPRVADAQPESIIAVSAAITRFRM